MSTFARQVLAYYVVNCLRLRISLNLSCLLQSSDFDVIFVTESWLRHDFPDSLLLSNTAYDLFRKDRPDGYGGVAVVSFDLLPIYSSLERVAFDLVYSTASCYLFICFYNPPSCVNSVNIITLCSLIDFLSMTKSSFVYCWRLQST